MAAGFVSMGKCHATANDAIDFYYSSQPSMAVYNGSNNLVSVIQYKKINGVWKFEYTANQGALQASLTAPTNITGSCEYDPYSENPFNLTLADGALLGGAILLCWAIAFGVRAYSSTLNSTDEREYQND